MSRVYDADKGPLFFLSSIMSIKLQLEQQALWGRLKPRYRLLVSAPCIVGLLMMLLMLYPNGLLLIGWLGISADEPVIQSANGQLFMLCFCASAAATLVLWSALTYWVISWWLVSRSNCTQAEVRLAMRWQTYPAEWLADNLEVGDDRAR